MSTQKHAKQAPRRAASPTRAEFDALRMEVYALREALRLIGEASRPVQEETGYGHALAVQARRRGLHEVSA